VRFARLNATAAALALSALGIAAQTHAQSTLINAFASAVFGWRQLPCRACCAAENSHGSAPISVVACAEQKASEAGGYDFIFCVFDRDTHKSFARAREKIKALAGRSKKPLPIREIVSIPCFEVWVLLHFERSDAAHANCAAVIERIRNSYLPEYAKAESRTANQLMARIDDAIDSATDAELQRGAAAPSLRQRLTGEAGQG
jgi:hypothetical protein